MGRRYGLALPLVVSLNRRDGSNPLRRRRFKPMTVCRPKAPTGLHSEFSHHTPRKLSRNLTLRYQNREYKIQGQGRGHGHGHGYRLRGSTVTVCESFDGPVSLRMKTLRNGNAKRMKSNNHFA